MRLAQIDRQIAEAPQDPALRLRRADALRHAGRLNSALAAYQRAEERGGHAGHIARGRGQALLAAGRPGEALEELNKAVLLLGPDAATLHARSRAFAALKQPGAAAEDLLRAWDDAGEHSAEAAIELARALSEALEIDHALAILDAAISRIGPRTSLTSEWFRIAYTHDPEAEIEPRVARWITAAKTAGDPMPARLVVLQAEALEGTGQFKAAHAAYRAAHPLIQSTVATTRAQERLLAR